MTVNDKALDILGYSDQKLVGKWANSQVPTEANEAFAILFARYDRAIDTKDPNWASQPLRIRFQIFFHYCRRLKADFDSADELSLETWIKTDFRLHQVPKPEFFESETFRSQGLLPWLRSTAKWIHIADWRKTLTKPDPENPDASQQTRYISWEITVNGETFDLEIEAQNNNFQLAPIPILIAGKVYPLSLPVDEKGISLVRAVCLQSAILQLEAQYRDVFVLINLEQMTTVEVVEKLGLTAANVLSLNHRAKKKLRQLLPDDFLDGFSISVQERSGN